MSQSYIYSRSIAYKTKTRIVHDERVSKTDNWRLPFRIIGKIQFTESKFAGSKSSTYVWSDTKSSSRMETNF